MSAATTASGFLNQSLKKPPKPIVGGGGPNPGPIKPPQTPGGGNPSA